MLEGLIIGLHIASVHLPQREYNNFNPGIYARTESGWTVGAYYNSQRHPSLYAGREFRRGRLALMVGAVTGYERAPVLPAAAPSILLDGGWRLTFLPPIEKKGSFVVHLSKEL